MNKMNMWASKFLSYFIAILSGIWTLIEVIGFFFPSTWGMKISTWNNGASFWILLAFSFLATFYIVIIFDPKNTAENTNREKAPRLSKNAVYILSEIKEKKYPRHYTTLESVRSQALNKRLSKLFLEYELLNEQLTNELNSASRSRLNGQLETIEKEIKQVEYQLDKTVK